MSLAPVLVGIVLIIQLSIMIAEMFFWRDHRVHERLGFSAPDAEKAQPIVANAGLYNGFLAAGLLWSLVRRDSDTSTFFLLCIFVAGLYGAVTLNKIAVRKNATVFLQSAPAALALIALWTAGSI